MAVGIVIKNKKTKLFLVQKNSVIFLKLVADSPELAGFALILNLKHIGIANKPKNDAMTKTPENPIRSANKPPITAAQFWPEKMPALSIENPRDLSSLSLYMATNPLSPIQAAP